MTPTTCARCGSPLPDGARFCPNCGFPVDAPPPSERKVVTVVFVDLVGSTRLSAAVDPELYREAIAAYYQVVTEELEALNGRAYNFAGDAVVGVFGIPQAHDDDAVRTVRAGLAITERIGRVGDRLRLPLPLRCRIGVNTGPVAIGSEAAERGLLFGAVVNAAARLQQSAPPGSVVVGETTWLLAKERVEFGEATLIEAKGFDDALRAWPVVGLASGTTGRSIAFIDRRGELRLLRDAFERAVESGRPHMVTLLGEPGIGKSRVAEEFLSGLPEHTQVLVGRANPFEEDVTFAPVGQILLQRIGERSDARPERLRSSLESFVVACCPRDDAREVAVRLGYALGLGEDAHEERRFRGAEIRAGLVALLEAMASEAPIVLVFEDVHLAEPPLLDLVEQLVREAKEVRLLVLCVARYDLLDDRPDWGGGLGDSLNLYLEPMGLEEGTQLAREVGELDEASARRIAEHAGGNPFFIVETTGMLLHEGVPQVGAREVSSRPPLPPTVQAVIASRIDHLPPAARDLVRKASVFARSTFETSELALIADPDEDALAILEDEELLVRDEERKDVWRFRHGMVRDVAYESLPKRERMRLHLRVADGLSRDPVSTARYPRSIAYHLEQAARASLDLDPSDRTLADRAADALAGAGRLALDASLARAAADLYARALALAGPERDRRPREASMLANLGEARYWLGEFESAVSPLERALELGGDDPGIRAQACRFLGDIELSVHGGAERAALHLDTALAAARELGDPRILARTLLQVGWVPYHGGDLAAARSIFEEALAVARANADGDRWSEARALTSMAVVTSPVGDEADCERMAREALALAEAMDDAFAIAVARTSVASSLRRMLRLDEAAPMLDAAVGTFRELGARWELADALIGRGIVARLAGRSDAAAADLREATRICREVKEVSLLGWANAELSTALLALGDVSGGRQVLEEDGDALAEEDTRDALVLVMVAEGAEEDARAADRESLRKDRERGWPNPVAAHVVRSAQLFGSDAAGGDAEIERARDVLRAAHWDRFLDDPDLRMVGELRDREATWTLT